MDEGPSENVLLWERLTSWLGKIDRYEPLRRSGRNNQVYEVQSGGRRYCCKKYFRNQGEEFSSRQQAEWIFSKHVFMTAKGRAPEPIEMDGALAISLFEFVEGEAFSNLISDSDVVDAFDFVECINQDRAILGKFPEASDSCFSISQHIKHVDRRLERFTCLGGDDESFRRMKSFVVSELRCCFEEARSNVALYCENEGIDLNKEICVSDRILSPSDFGFHNALRRKNGDICYLDFEYAGWDDPIKNVCDFFSQPDFPPPQSAFKSVLSQFMGGSLRSDLVELLLPLYAVKWSCIILNPFMATVQDRRSFAGNKLPMEKVLLAAKTYFQQHPARVLKSWPT